MLTELRDALKAVRVFKQRIPVAGIPAGTLGVFAAIASGRGSHVTELAAECALDPSTVSRAVAALDRAGFVGRAADPQDGRACVLTLTDSGRAAIADVIARYERGMSAALADWTPDELRTFSTLLHRFTHDLLEAA